jgi:hypothetical protein
LRSCRLTNALLRRKMSKDPLAEAGDHPRSARPRSLTRDEQAQNHAQAGIAALSVEVILDCLYCIGRRDSQHGLRS